MKLYKKSDMLYQDNYSWEATMGDDPEIIGSPDNVLFNRNEGYEVLDLINEIANDNDWKNKQSCEILERLIHDMLPQNIRGRSNVKDWLFNNWPQ